MKIAASPVTAEEISAAIGMHVAVVRPRDWDYHSSHAMRELMVELTDGTTFPLLFKDLDPRHQLDEAERTRPAFMYNARREIDVYRDMLPVAGLNTPRFYGAVVDERSGTERFWLFIEHVTDATPLWQCEIDLWPVAAQWLRRFHELRPAKLPASLLRHDKMFYQRWIDRAVRFKPELQPIARRYNDVIARLTTMPPTFIHGEFYASNILVQSGRIRPVDWETAAVGPALIDLAALCAGQLDDHAIESIISAYGPCDARDLDACRLHLAIQWLGWSSDWKPPKEHAHNWLAEATILARRMGIA